MPTKDFKTVAEQLEILKKRGLSIPDENKASVFLLNNNYYRISGYSLTLRSHDVFYDGTTFQNIIDIYEFDYKLRHILLKYLEPIEVKFKSVYSHIFSQMYGPVGYLNKDNFTDDERYNIIIKKANDQIAKRIKSEAYLKHYINDLNQDLPLWAFVDLLTIADISILYEISKKELKSEIQKVYSISAHILQKFMHSMTILRNLCAHGSRIYNRIFEQRPNLSQDERLLLIKNSKGQEDNAHLFGFIIIMKRLLSAEDFESMKTEIICITNEYPFVKMKYYGFNPNWIELL